MILANAFARLRFVVTTLNSDVSDIVWPFLGFNQFRDECFDGVGTFDGAALVFY